MKFLFHIGSPKAGSSFLQSVCARSRAGLKAQGIHFPPGTTHDERAMLDGRISAGNARAFAAQISADRWDKVESWLMNVAAVAEAQDCDRVLVSSEWLLGALAEQGRLVELSRRMADRDIGVAGLLLLLRDPVEQFISLYKHRAKSGTVGPICEWAEHGYQLPGRLAGIREQLPASRADLVVRQYGKQAGSLERVFFEQWLGVPVPSGTKGLIVNPSLSLSELVLLRKIHAFQPGLVPYLYERLLAIEPGLKGEGTVMGEHARREAAKAVALHVDEWRHWNLLLPEAERLSIPAPGADTGPEPDSLELSSSQLAALAQLLAEAATPRLMLQLFWSMRLRPMLSRIKWSIWPWRARRSPLIH